MMYICFYVKNCIRCYYKLTHCHLNIIFTKYIYKIFVEKKLFKVTLLLSNAKAMLPSYYTYFVPTNSIFENISLINRHRYDETKSQIFGADFLTFRGTFRLIMNSPYERVNILSSNN